MYNYFVIRSDRQCTKRTDAAKLMDFLDSRRELRSTGPGQFANESSFPWCQVVVVAEGAFDNKARNRGSKEAHSVELMFSATNMTARDSRYEELGVEIASFLGWELVLLPGESRVWP